MSTSNNKEFAKEVAILEEWKLDLDNNIKSITGAIMKSELKSKLVFAETTTPIFPIKTIIGVACSMILILLTVVVMQPKNNIFEGEYTTVVAKQNFDLRDGTRVVLDKTSRLKPINKRTVSFDGRGYFEVESSPSNPFNIETSAGLVQVLGTQFSLQVNGDNLELYVTEGVVKFEKNGRSAMVYKGSFIEVTKDDIRLVNNVDDNYLSWYNDDLVFRSAKVGEVLSAINHHFNINLEMKDVLRGKNAVITSRFKDPDLQTVIDELVKNGCVIDEKAF